MRSRICSIAVAHPRRRLAREGSVDLAVRAARACLARSRYRRQEVQLLINAGVYRDQHQYEPAMASIIQDRLRIHRTLSHGRCLSLDLLNGGCGMLNAAQVADSMVTTGRTHLALIVSSEVNSDRRPAPGHDIEPSGAALLVDASPTSAVGFGRFAFETFDQHAELYRADLDLSVPRGRVVIQRQPAALQDAFVASSAALIDQLLRSEGLQREELAQLVVPDVSPDFPARLGAELGIPVSQVFAPATRWGGHALSTSTFVALHQAMATANIAPGQKRLLLAVAAGVTVGAAIYHG